MKFHTRAVDLGVGQWAETRDFLIDLAAAVDELQQSLAGATPPGGQGPASDGGGLTDNQTTTEG